MSQLIKQSHASTGVPLWKSESAISGGSFTAEFPDIWAGSPPTTTDDAVNRLSMLLYSRTVVNGTLAETTPQSKILVHVNDATGGAQDRDTFVVKYTQDGIPLWMSRIAGSGADEGHGIATDSTGAMIVMGRFRDSAITIYNADKTVFGTIPLIGGTNDVYIVKYDANGFGVWGTRVAGSGEDGGFLGVSVDSANNVLVTGSYSSSPVSVFNANGTVFTTLAQSGGGDLFIVKYSPLGFGIWATRLAGTGSDTGDLIQTDSAGNIYAFGRYTSSPLTIFNSDGTTYGTLINAGGEDCFLIKFTSAGFGTWATRFSGTGSDQATNMFVNPAGEIFLTGLYSSSVLTLFNSDTTTFTTLPISAGFDTFIAKYTTNGFGVWATRLTGTNNEFGRAITSDTAGNVYATGFYTSNPMTILNADGSTFKTLPNLSNNGQQDMYLIKFNSDGQGQWALRSGGTGNDDQGLGVGTDASGNVYVCGRYNSQPLIVFNANDTIFQTLAIIGGSDAYIYKVNANGQGVWIARVNATNNDFGSGISVSSFGVGLCGDFLSAPLYIRSAGM